MKHYNISHIELTLANLLLTKCKNLIMNLSIDNLAYIYEKIVCLRIELNYINTFKSWINNIFTNHNKDLNFNWFVLNQNEVLFDLFEYRNKTSC